MSSILWLDEIGTGFPSHPDENWTSYRFHIERTLSLESPGAHISDSS